MDSCSPVFLILLVAIVLVVVGVALGTSTRSTSAPREIMRVSSHRTKQTSGFETLLGLLAIGVASAALFKFIESGGLTRLLNRIGNLPIEVNGRMTTIEAAVRDEAFVRSVLMDALEEKLAMTGQVEGSRTNIEDHDAASDIAEMLRVGVERRMRERGL